ncbi:MAG: aminotransferase class I/II-fold pyridoxal phosphate-dependent enzyme [Polyangiaceae bacterium]|nr:aminotransferase class I/II-fold pyridoxal phosphate-dependent enzyme [Polyangiaceae bacterium]
MTTRQRYEALKAKGLKLDLTRGQPGDDNFDLSNPMLTIVDERTLVTPSKVALRNYPGGVAGLAEARELFAPVLGLTASETIVGNNSSLALLSNSLMWAMLVGVVGSPEPWCRTPTKFLVTVPGYDRHFTMLEQLGIEMIPIRMTGEGPDMDAVERTVANDPSVRGMVFVPTYSNPTGETVSDNVVRRLAAMPTAAPDFTIFADDAYVVHHLGDEPPRPLNLVRTCAEVGNPNRTYLYASTSKITFAGAGLGFLGSSTTNIAYLTNLMGTQTICPNKIEQYRHVLFLGGYAGGIPGIMKEHARILRPKFEAVDEILGRELGGSGLATWTRPQGGYFSSLDTTRPVANRVVMLAKEAGVALTPAGATYPGNRDPNNSNIRLAPTRPPLAEVRLAMEVVAVCIKLASESN